MNLQFNIPAPDLSPSSPDAGKDAASIDIISISMWPCASYLGEYLQEALSPAALKGDQCSLELGCGAHPIPSMVLSRLGVKRLYLHDKPGTAPHIQRILAANAIGNYNLLLGDWSACHKGLEGEPDQIDYIVASDIFYERKQFGPIMEALASLMYKHPRARCLIAYELRDPEETIWNWLALYRLHGLLVNRRDSLMIFEFALEALDT